MPNKIKQIECGPECGFAVRGPDEQELVNVIKTHSLKVHNMVVAQDDLQKLLTEV